MKGYMPTLVLVGGLALVGAVMSLLLTPFLDLTPGNTAAVALASGPQSGGGETWPNNTPRYLPPQPGDAPENIREAVMLGSRLMAQTGQLVPENVGNDLSCNSCHFNGGITSGGRNGGISLVGTAAAYPLYRKRQNYATSLSARVNDCFQRSLNGRPLPPDGRDMTALLTYLQWISRGVPVYADVPWTGLRPIESQHAPNAGDGRQVYQRLCAVCHGGEGQGTPIAAPLWGSRSFNSGAGMHSLANFAAFAHDNMPRENPLLTPEQALDVAAFVTAQPRPELGHP